ncbi:zinc finger and BTB domain-containing protein 5-like [Myripristis murdjan]|uniref:zinc finger and BTB domain-containing protein 5-like n=1 Tax=Myripristis murdjan TaxID=586833 RepID=UPI0011762CC2|nr:zinc finger and BTB domain-containing protein 5-like [Myripristis murdjan]
MDFPGHFQHIFQQLNHQRLHAQLCDCVVVVGGQSFQAHRSILAASSSHFRALLSSSDGDEGGGGGGGAGADRGGGSRGPSVMELDPEVVTPEAFSTLLDMIYTSTLSLGASNVMDVLLAASHLHLNTVVKACKLHLSKRNFPASPPKGWRSVQQPQEPLSSQVATTAPSGSQLQRSGLHQHLELSLVTSAMEEELNEGEMGMEVSQSGEGEDEGLRGRSVGEQSAVLPSRHKRKSPLHEESLGSGKRTCRDRSPTVTRSTINGEELFSPDSLRMGDGLQEGRGEEETEEKYEATKGESEEIQLPSQSDSSTGAMAAWEKDGDTGGEAVVKVKVGEEGEEEGDEQKMAVIEVKKENLSLSSPELDTEPTIPPSPTGDYVDAPVSDEKLATASPAEGDHDVSTLKPQLCTDLQTDTQTEGGGVGEESIDGEGLDSLSELAFSCFLNPSSESVMGALEVEDSLANLTAAAATASTTSDAQAAAGDVVELCQNSEDTNPSSAPASDCSSSLVFPVTPVPFQQLLPSQGHGFSDTLILQPTQSSLAGFLRGVRPGVNLQASLIQPSRAGKGRGGGGSGALAFRRIAPKAVPGSEACSDPDPSSSSGSAGDSADRPALTRASEDVLSKCKKAAAEDHVLLVEGEKKYACKICCKTFMNLTDCKKHIRVHTGEKPYPCPKCGKRFSQSSHLYKHSKNTCLNWKGDNQPFPDTLI